MRFSHRSLALAPRRPYMSISPLTVRENPSPSPDNPYEVRSFPKNYAFTDPRTDKIFSKTQDLRNPFLPVLTESKPPAHERDPANTLTSLRRQGDHARLYTQPPEDVFEAVFEIYATRFSTNYNRPVGGGVLISPTLALTTHTAIPTSDSAFRCHLQFISNGEIYKFAPRNQFKTHSTLNLTIVSVEPMQKSTRRGVRIRHGFFLQEFSRVYWASGASGPIEQLDTKAFFFYSAESLLQGTALFDSNWELVGITLTSVTHVRFNEARRVDHIYNFVHSEQSSTAVMFGSKSERSLVSRGRSFAPRAEDILQSTGSFRTIGHQPARTDLVHWLLWGGRAVMTYDMKEQTWKTTVVTLTDRMEEYAWCFLPDSRSVILPDQTLMILGGTIGSEGTSIVLRYLPFQGTVSPSSPMLNARQGAAVCYLDEYVYAIGGIKLNKSAERYSTAREVWQYILPTNYERFEATAVAHEKHVIVVGGSASEAAGQTIERFGSVSGEWEVLRILLPRPLISPGLCPLNHSRIAILGGRKMNRVYVLQSSYSHTFSLQEATAFPDYVETVYPVVYSQSHRQLLIFNSAEHKDRPVLIKYAENCFSTGDYMYVE